MSPSNDHWLHHRAAALNLRRMITMGLTRTPDRLGDRLTTSTDRYLPDRHTSCHAQNGGATSSVDLRV